MFQSKQIKGQLIPVKALAVSKQHAEAVKRVEEARRRNATLESALETIEEEKETVNKPSMKP